MLRQPRNLAIGLLALTLLSLTWVPTAHAHPRAVDGAPSVAPQPLAVAPISPAEEALAPPPPAAEIPAAIPPASAAALLGIVLLALGAVRWPITTVRMLLALLLLVAAAESAVHSVHHLDNPRAGASCQVLTITQQLHGDTSPELPSGAPVVEFHPCSVVAVPHDAPQSVHRPDEGRAPPLPLA